MHLRFPALLMLCGFVFVRLIGGADQPDTPNPRLSGAPFVRNWTADDYDAAPVNWGVAQHPKTGFLYVGNNYGLLEHDGASWRLYELPDGNAVRSIAIDTEGTIWAGSLDEIVKFTPRPNGVLHLENVTPPTPAQARSVGNVTRACATPDGVYFSASRIIYRLRSAQPARSWEMPAPVTGLWWSEGCLYLAAGVTGIFRLDGDALTPVAATPAGLSVTVYAERFIAPSVRVLLTNRGPLRWAGPGQPLEFLSRESETLFLAKPAEAATFLADGTMVFGFLSDGVQLIDSHGSPLGIVDETLGLPSNRIEHLLTDAEGGVWVAQRAGLARLQLESAFARFGPAQGLSGSPRLMRRHYDRLYIAHNEGVVWRDDQTGRFEAIPELSASISTLFVAEGKLFGPGTTLHEFAADNTWRQVLSGSQLTITPLPGHPQYYLGGNTTGVTLLRYDGKLWENLGRLTSVPEGATRFRDGGDGTLWAVAYNGMGVWRLDVRGPPGLELPAQFFGERDGLPPARRRDSPRIAKLGPDLYVTSAAGTRRFDPATRRFTRDLRIEGMDADDGAMAITNDGEETWWFVRSDAERLGRVAATGDGRWRFSPVSSGALRGVVPNSIYHDRTAQTLWIAAQGGLLSLDLRETATRALPPLTTFLRSITDPTTGTPVDLTEPLPASQTELRFTFAAPTFAGDVHGHSRTRYRTKLDGIDHDWSAWTETNYRDYTNLPYRPHTFRVEALAIDGRTSAQTTVDFSIAPPWWLHVGALVSYVVGTGLSVVSFFMWRTRALRRRNLQLEATVAARTAEIARLRQIDRDESVAAKLAEEKARLETLRYQLNPHFLYNALNSIRALIYKRPPAAGDMVQQLADLCRITLTRHEELAPLRDEFAMLRLYLEMEKTRWSDLLEIEVTSTPEADAQLLPPFLLLPLVENALKHGREVSPDVLQLRLIAHCDADHTLVIEVANSGPWITPGTGTSPSTGIGLENLRERLRRYYPGTHEFTVDHADNWVRATIRLPLGSAAPASASSSGEARTPTSAA